MGRKKNEIVTEQRADLGYGDTMETTEIDTILDQIVSINYLDISGRAWQCLIAILWLTGKRISEVVCLRISDVRIRGNYLTITFSVLKKRGKRTKRDGTFTIDNRPPPRRTKRITLDNPYSMYVTNWWDSIKDRETFMFPRPQTKMRYIYPKYVWDVIQMLGLEQPVSCHLFRHTLATQMAEDGATAWELKSWFDWENISTADEYVSSAGMSTKRLSDRKW